MYYVAVDIGCIECGEDSHVVGVFTSEELAAEANKKQIAFNEQWRGEHHFEVFPIDAIDKEFLVKY